MYCTFCKKTNHILQDCIFKRRRYYAKKLPNKFSYKPHFYSKYYKTPYCEVKTRRNPHLLMKISKQETEPTKQAQCLQRETNKGCNDKKLPREKDEQSKPLLEENYENISTDSDKIVEDNDKTILKLKVKRLQKRIEVQKEELKTKFKKLEKENELLKKENLALSLLYFTEYSSDYFNTDKKCTKVDVKM